MNNTHISEIIYPLHYHSGSIRDNKGNVIIKMNRETGTTSLPPSYRDDLAKEIIELYNEKYSPETVCFSWSIHDVIERAKEQDKEITESQAIEILARVKHGHDANIGVNWDVLDAHTDMYFDELKEPVNGAYAD